MPSGNGKTKAPVSLSGLAAKRIKMGALLTKLSEAEDTLRQSEQEEQDVLAIVKELVANPGKLKGAKAAIMSDMFLKEDFEQLHESIVKLDRVPLGMFASVLAKISAEATKDALKSLKKVDRQCVARLFYYVTQTGPLDKVPSRNPTEFVDYFVARAKQVNPRFEQNLKHAMDNLSSGWPEIGHFKLCASGGGDELKPKISHVAWMGHKVPFPAYVSVDSKWAFDGNWCIALARVSTPVGHKPKIEINLKSLFAEAVCEKMSPAVRDWRVVGGDGGRGDDSPQDASPAADRARKPNSPKPVFDEKKFKNMVKQLKE